MGNWELLARERVRDTIAAYTHAGDRGRIGELAECFTPDGVLEITGGERANGRPEIVRVLSALAERAAGARFFIRHHVSSVRFDQVSVDRIACSSYFAVLTPSGLDHWGRYRDVLVPVGDRWLFQHRKATVDAHITDSWLERA